MWSIWAEIRSDYIDEEEGKVFIDAWKTDSGNEQGEVVAKVDVNTGEVEYLNESARTDPYAQEEIGEVIRDIESGIYEPCGNLQSEL